MSVSPTKVLAEATDTNDKSSETVLDDLVGYNLKRAYMIVQADFRDTLGEDGLTARVFSALSLVVENPNITQSELARTLRIERSGLVAIVDQLEERKLLTRSSVVGDTLIVCLLLHQTAGKVPDSFLCSTCSTSTYSTKTSPCR